MNTTNGQEQLNFFAAANSKDGFVSFFEQIFFCDAITRRYIIKGGPGTGKSSLLKKLALRAEERGETVEYYYCSSDTSSLDGIVIDGKTAIFDGTSPHCYDTRLPGATDEIINLGELWNTELLSSHRSEIAALGDQKAKAYKTAYGYLSAAGELGRTIDALTLPCVNTKKLSRSAERLIPKSGTKHCIGKRITRQVQAFGTRGTVRFDTLERQARHVTYINDYYGAGYLFIEALAKCATSSGFNVQISFDTTDTSKPRELYIPASGQFFGIVREGRLREDADTVNIKRFINSDKLAEVRFSLRRAIQAHTTLLELASASLKNAGAIHAKIEKYYIIAMDFARMDEVIKRMV